jgi:hypothetical protein
MAMSGDTKYTTFLRLEDGIELAVRPGSVSEDEAKEQMRRVNKHFMQFAGGTQSICLYIEPTL